MPLKNFEKILAQRAYPGDTVEESNVLRAWLYDHGQMYDDIAFNVRLGEGVRVDLPIDPTMAEAFRKNTQLRADVILFQGDHATIVEVKKRGLPNAMGQLLAYRLLYMTEHPERPDPSMLLVTENIRDEVIELFEAHGCQVAIVEPMEPEV